MYWNCAQWLSCVDLAVVVFGVCMGWVSAQWLDALGKWSLLDSYVMVAMMVAFNFKVLALAPFKTTFKAS